MVTGFILGTPETPTVSHSFPKLCAALQRKSEGRVLRAGNYLGASEATIASKRGSPRSGSQSGCSFSWP